MTLKPTNAEPHPSTMKFLFALLGGPILFLVLLLTPISTTLTGDARKVAAIAGWMSVWWLTGVIPVGATALIPFALFPFLGIMTGEKAVSSFAHWMNFLFLGGFLLAAAMERWQLHKRIALVIIDTIGVTPRLIVLGFMVATGFISMWISNTATAVMMLPVGMAVLTKVRDVAGDEIGDRIAPALMLSIAYASSIGGVGTVIGSSPNAVFVSQVSTLYGQTFSFYDWLKIGIPFVLTAMPITWFYLVRIQFPLPSRMGPECSDLIRHERRSLGPLSRGEIIIGIIFTLTALGWIIRQDIDLGSWTFHGIQSYFPMVTTDATIAMCAALLLFAIPVDIRKREFVLDLKSALKIPWDLLLIIGGGICLADGFKESGLSEWFAYQLVFLKGLHPVLIVMICVALVTFLTELTSNTATATIFIPIMGAIAAGIGQHPYILMVPCCIASSMAFMLPVATPPNAIVYGSGHVSIQQMSRTGFWLNLIVIVLITLLTILVINPLLGVRFDTVPDWALPDS